MRLKEVKAESKLRPNEKVVFEDYDQISYMNLLKLEFALIHQIKVLSEKVSRVSSRSAERAKVSSSG